MRCLKCVVDHERRLNDEIRQLEDALAHKKQLLQTHRHAQRQHTPPADPNHTPSPRSAASPHPAASPRPPSPLTPSRLPKPRPLPSSASGPQPTNASPQMLRSAAASRATQPAAAVPSSSAVSTPELREKLAAVQSRLRKPGTTRLLPSNGSTISHMRPALAAARRSDLDVNAPAPFTTHDLLARTP